MSDFIGACIFGALIYNGIMITRIYGELLAMRDDEYVDDEEGK